MSTMSVKFDGFRMTVDLWDLIANLTGDERANLIDALACSDAVINEVANQILDGWTSLGSCGSKSGGGDPEATRGLDGARMRIAKASSEIAAEEIAALAKRIERERELGKKGWDAYHALAESNVRRYA